MVEKMVCDLLNAGTIKPRSWSWPMLGPYNGNSGEERVVGWQKTWAGVYAKLIPTHRTCSICGSTETVQNHNEDYLRPLNAKPICGACHKVLHRRFSAPRPWLQLVAAHRRSDTDWFADLCMVERTPEEAAAERARLMVTPLSDCSVPYHNKGVAQVYPNFRL